MGVYAQGKMSAAEQNAMTNAVRAELLFIFLVIISMHF